MPNEDGRGAATSAQTPSTPHRRYNPLADEWVLVSAERTQRPWQGDVLPPADSDRSSYDPACYLCPGNSRASGQRNPAYTSTFAFTNDFAALRPDGHTDRTVDGLLTSEGERGTCRVLCFSPRHDLTLGQLDPGALRDVIDLWAEESSELGREFAWVQVFENRGREMGASNPHPHGQIWAGSAIPVEAAREVATQRRHYRRTGRRLLLDYATQESAGPRVIAEDDDWLLAVPYWATWPFETLMIPKAPAAQLPDLAPAQRDSLGTSLVGLLTRYDNLFEHPFPYSMGWHQAPFGGRSTPGWQLHAHFYPPLLRSPSIRKFMVGYELLAEPQRDLTPEEAARRLRAASDQPSSRSARASQPRELTAPSTELDPSAMRQHLIQRYPEAAASLDLIETVRGPGRVNLIGEHTDYNDGFVLPVAIDLRIVMALIPTQDRRVEVTLLADGTTSSFDLDPVPGPRGSWIDYVAGVAWSLASEGFPLRGYRAVLATGLPMSSGLSSSAALELASAWALLDAGSRPTTDADRMDLARIAQRAENEYVGVRCGLMDQFASSLGQPGAALLLDCRSSAYRPVALPLERHAIVICDSASPRRLAASLYNARREECERAASLIAARRPAVRTLRDVDPAMLAEVGYLLDDETRMRAEHVVAENARVLACVDALEAGDLVEVGRLFAASHASLRDLYEVSSAELDALVAIASAVPGAVAARLTGAGFGGCTVNLVERGAIDRFTETVTVDYRARTGLTPRVMVVEPSAGAGLV